MEQIAKPYLQILFEGYDIYCPSDAPFGYIRGEGVPRDMRDVSLDVMKWLRSNGYIKKVDFWFFTITEKGKRYIERTTN